jgi:hypothetical protein
LRELVKQLCYPFKYLLPDTKVEDAQFTLLETVA